MADLLPEAPKTPGKVGQWGAILGLLATAILILQSLGLHFDNLLGSQAKLEAQDKEIQDLRSQVQALKAAQDFIISFRLNQIDDHLKSTDARLERAR